MLVSPTKHNVSPEVAQAIAGDVYRELYERCCEAASGYYGKDFQRWLLARQITSELFAVAMAEGLEKRLNVQL